MLRHFYNEILAAIAHFRANILMKLNVPDDLFSKWQNIFDPVLIHINLIFFMPPPFAPLQNISVDFTVE